MEVAEEEFTWFTRSITAILNVPLSFALDLLARVSNLVTVRKARPTTAVMGRRGDRGVSAPGHRRVQLGLLPVVVFCTVSSGQRTSSMLTLGLIAMAIPFWI